MESLLNLLESTMDVKSWLKEHADHIHSFFRVKVSDLLQKKKAENSYERGSTRKAREQVQEYTIEGLLGEQKVPVLLSWHASGLLVYVKDIAGKRALQNVLEDHPDIFSLVPVKHSKIQGLASPFLLVPIDAEEELSLTYGAAEKPVAGVP